MSVEKARKEEPARNRDSCFSDRREVIAVEGASGEMGVVAFSRGSAMVMREGLVTNAIPRPPS